MQSMNRLDYLEALAQRLIEGTFHRLFQSPLPPAVVNQNHDKSSGVITEIDIINSIQKANHWVLRLEGRELRLGEPVVRIGRALDNDIVLTDPVVARYHAELRWRGGCYHLCPPTPTRSDLTVLSTADQTDESQQTPQTTVNHQFVIEHPLTSGDVIRLGDTKLMVVVEGGTA